MQREASITKVAVLFLLMFFCLLMARSCEANALELGGQMVFCPSTSVEIDNHISSEGESYGYPVNTIILNTKLLKRLPPNVQLFVFLHECGHIHIGISELKADCWALRTGVTKGWFDRGTLDPICRSWGNDPATASHPSATTRCSRLYRCFIEMEKNKHAESTHSSSKERLRSRGYH